MRLLAESDWRGKDTRLAEVRGLVIGLCENSLLVQLNGAEGAPGLIGRVSDQIQSPGAIHEGRSVRVYPAE